MGACSSGSAKADGSAGGFDGRIVPDGATASDVAHPGDFITGDVNGVTFRAEMVPAAGTQGLDAGMIWATAGTTSKVRGWTLYVPNTLGDSLCSSVFIMLSDTTSFRNDVSGATCTVTVTAAAPAVDEVFAGTFTANVPATPPSVPEAVAVTNGAFHVTRTVQ